MSSETYAESPGIFIYTAATRPIREIIQRHGCNYINADGKMFVHIQNHGITVGHAMEKLSNVVEDIHKLDPHIEIEEHFP